MNDKRQNDMAMKTNSNTYTLIYSSVMVIVVAFLLAFVYQALKPMQDANVALDLKKQILYSLNLRDLDNAQAERTYNEVVKREEQVDGNTLYVCEVDGKPKYVLPLKGMGLWGGISGFIAVNDDRQTVYGPTSTTRARRPASGPKSRTTALGRRSSAASTSSRRARPMWLSQ